LENRQFDLAYAYANLGFLRVAAVPLPMGLRPVVALARATGSAFDPEGLSLWVEARLDIAWF